MVSRRQVHRIKFILVASWMITSVGSLSVSRSKKDITGAGVYNDPSRRTLIQTAMFTFPLISAPLTSQARESGASNQSNDYAPAFVQDYGDFVKAGDGDYSYKDIKLGSGESAAPGDRVVFDWSGYTIGYFGRPFQAKGGPQGGAFDKDLDYERVILGSGAMILGVEKALMTMKTGGIRQVIIPYGSFSYPPNDLEHNIVGPKPTTFSGQRALNFVLENPRVDRTLLFNLKLIRVDKKNEKGGFTRG